MLGPGAPQNLETALVAIVLYRQVIGITLGVVCSKKRLLIYEIRVFRLINVKAFADNKRNISQ